MVVTALEAAEPLTIAYYCTGHGLGHATRAIEVCKHLVGAGHSVIVVTGAPAAHFRREVPADRLSFRKAILDVGAMQLDAFSVDMKASLEEYHKTAVVHRDAILQSEAGWLQAVHADLVVSDIVPLACAAAAAAGVTCVCVSNFSWDFIYSEYLTAVGSQFRAIVWQIADDYASATALLRLPGYCPMPAFRHVIDCPMVVRPARRTRQQVREALGLSEDVCVVIFMFGGQPSGNWQLKSCFLPANWQCIVCSSGKLPGGHPLPENFTLAPADAYIPDLVNACDCVLGKIGYGSTSECLEHRKPLIFVRRDYFNEEPFLRKLLEVHGAAIEMKRRDFLEGHWGPFLERALDMSVRYEGPSTGAQFVAAKLEEICRTGASWQSTNKNDDNSAKLRDTIIWGYFMQRYHSRVDVEIPEWYTRGQLPVPLSNTSLTRTASALPPLDDIFEFVGGEVDLDLHPDTCEFLNILAHLDDSVNTQELPEHRAAKGLFRWEEEVIVSRAPGRLDVMGGIADYSGSLVLQMPISEACHVALQRHSMDNQRLWKHMKARHQRVGDRPAVRVVSFHADATNRGPAFDMDLSDLLDKDGQPISYEQAREYFSRDPAHSWGAYVVGTFVVLQIECGMRFDDGISLLIVSDVPEGKGVSSSAAVEVSVMKGITEAYGMKPDGRQLAILCQKVENHVVGAPCGIMDQMTSAVGLHGRLLSLLCQPAEVQGLVDIPAGIRFWGIDSGIRHSVGGVGYGDVRAAAFMGMKMISTWKHQADVSLCSRTNGSSTNGEVHPRTEQVQHKDAIGGGYLANLAPSVFLSVYQQRLPTSMTGHQFLVEYGDHWDAATSVLPDRVYPVRAATTHAVMDSFRVRNFQQVLSGSGGDDRLCVLGELMYQSHSSYGACGLGSQGTDNIVELVRAEYHRAVTCGESPQVFGAKITGGGSGGTVCVLAHDTQEGSACVARVVQQYTQQTAYSPQVFRGSSSGAKAFGVVRVKRRNVVPPQSPSPPSSTT